jgi:hypothetical protein
LGKIAFQAILFKNKFRFILARMPQSNRPSLKSKTVIIPFTTTLVLLVWTGITFSLDVDSLLQKAGLSESVSKILGSQNISSLAVIVSAIFFLVGFYLTLTKVEHFYSEQAEKFEMITAKTGQLKETNITKTVKSNTKKEPNIEFKKTSIINVDVYNDIDIRFNSEGEDRLLIAEFIYKPTKNSLPKVHLRAEIKADNLQSNQPKHPIKGIWFKHVAEYREFIPNDVWSVVVGLVVGKTFFLNEYDTEYRWELGYDERLTPKIYKVNGDRFDITVRLIGDYKSGDILLNKTFKFRLLMEPELDFKEVD